MESVYLYAGANLMPSKLKDSMLNLLFAILSVGAIPNHIAFIMDGNRRYAKKHNLIQGMGHKLGFISLISILKHCLQLGVRHITIYAFSIDNFKRGQDEVQTLMELLQEATESLLKEDSIVNQYNVRVHFAGDLMLLDGPLRLSMERLMEATSENSKAVLSVCVAYTSTDEITRGVGKACEERLGYEGSEIGLVDVEKHLDLSVSPDPDIMIRTSGETRLSNFLLWQSACCLLYSPSIEWPEISVWHLVWAVLHFQRMHSYFDKKKKATMNCEAPKFSYTWMELI